MIDDDVVRDVPGLGGWRIWQEVMVLTALCRDEIGVACIASGLDGCLAMMDWHPGVMIILTVYHGFGMQEI